MNLRAELELSLGDLDLSVDLEAPAGMVTAVLGPNGAGKTTLLNCISGTVPIDAGRITLGEVVLDEPPGTYVPPERRRIGAVHQQYLLFPHLDVLHNVAFGPRSRGLARREAREVAARWLDRIGASSLAHMRPSELSGGQAQRVALARALACEPEALLLDEPLSALDARAREEMRRELRELLARFSGPTVVVTHDPLDALVLAERVAIIESGRIAQVGSISEVTTRPRSPYIAQLIGTNLLHGVASRTTISLDTRITLATAEPHEGAVLVTVDPAAVALHGREPEGSPRNRWRSSIARLETLGDRVRVHLGPPLELVAEITSLAASELVLSEGDEVWVSVKATEIRAYPE